MLTWGKAAPTGAQPDVEEAPRWAPGYAEVPCKLMTSLGHGIRDWEEVSQE